MCLRVTRGVIYVAIKFYVNTDLGYRLSFEKRCGGYCMLGDQSIHDYLNRRSPLEAKETLF